MFNLFKKKKPAPVEVEPEKVTTRTSFRVMYSYEWKDDVPVNERDTDEHPSRPFCKKLMGLNRHYTRVDIEKMSAALGYSVWDRCGGDGCRHQWVSHAVKA